MNSKGLSSVGNGLSHQFLLVDRDCAISPPGIFISRDIDSWRLYSSPDLPVISILNARGEIIGWLLGWASNDEQLITDKIVLDSEFSGSDQSVIEARLYELSGRWVAVILRISEPKVYLDPLASLSLVYSTSDKAIASTPELLNATYSPLYSIDELLENDLWYPFGATAYLNVQRLLANHCLNLSGMFVTRHWPKASLPTGDWRQHIDDVVRLLQLQLISFARDYPVRIGLTAGMDSRVMLAIALASGATYQFWTREDTSYSAQTDVKVAMQLARDYQLTHKLLRADAVPKLSENELLEKLKNIGFSVGGSPLKSAAIIDSIQEVAVAFTGIGGEIARAYYLSDCRDKIPTLTVDSGLHRAGLPTNTRFRSLGKSYIQNLPYLTELQRWALFYQENRVSAFGSVHRYAYQNGVIFVSPFSNRKIIETMFRLTLEEQQQNAFHLELINRQCPDLLQTPINPTSYTQKLKRRLIQIRNVFIALFVNRRTNNR